MRSRDLREWRILLPGLLELRVWSFRDRDGLNSNSRFPPRFCAATDSDEERISRTVQQKCLLTGGQPLPVIGDTGMANAGGFDTPYAPACYLPCHYVLASACPAGGLHCAVPTNQCSTAAIREAKARGSMRKTGADGRPQS